MNRMMRDVTRIKPVRRLWGRRTVNRELFLHELNMHK